MNREVFGYESGYKQASNLVESFAQKGYRPRLPLQRPSRCLGGPVGDGSVEFRSRRALRYAAESTATKKHALFFAA